MLRVECECGKALKVADELAGKKVRCPDCGEVVAVPKAGGDSGSGNPPRRPSFQDEDDDPAPSRNRRREAEDEDDDEDEEENPRKKKKSAQPVPMALILVVVGGLVLGCTGVVGAGGVWWFFSRDKAPAGQVDAKLPFNDNLDPGPKATPKEADKAKDEPKDLPKDLPKDTSKTPEPFKIALTEPIVKWSAATTPTLTVAVKFRIGSGQPNKDSKYTLVIHYPDAANTKQRYEVAFKYGADLQPFGGLGGEVKLISAPMSAYGQFCDLVLYETPSGSDSNIAVAQVRPEVTGTPPATTTTPTPPVTAKAKVELANLKVERAGKVFQFNAEYHLTDVKPDPLATYIWECDLQGKNGQMLKVQLAQFLGTDVLQKNTGKLGTVKEVPQPLMEPSPKFDMRIVETKPGVNPVVVSSKAIGVVSGEAAPAAVAALLTGGVVKSGKIMVVTFNYKFTTGNPDPKCAYRLLIEFKAGKKAAPAIVPFELGAGGQFKGEDVIQRQLPNQGHTHFDAVLVEISQAFPQGRPIGKHSGQIQGK